MIRFPSRMRGCASGWSGLYGALELACLWEHGALARWIERHLDAVRREIEAE